MLLLQEFDLEIMDRSGTKNQVADHLSRLEKSGDQEEISIRDSFPDEQLFAVSEARPWFADIANFVACEIIPPDLTSQQRKRFLHIITT